MHSVPRDDARRSIEGPPIQKLMRFPRVRVPLALLVVSVVMSCTDVPSAPHPLSPSSPRRSSGVTPPALVISQVYGGGGNSGATLKNDFIELFNPGGASVSLAGWSVQYASAAGTTWQVTALSGSIPPGGYYLVQEAQGSGGTAALPTPDAIGTIAMGATAGKVALASSTTALSGTCPAGVVDAVSFGTTASDCGAKTTATLSNTTAAIRGDLGCAYTKDLSVDFSTGAPAPRNSATPIHVCPGALPVGPLDHVVIGGSATVFAGGTTQLTATPQDANGQTVTTATTSWSSSDDAVAAVDATGLVTGVTASPSPVTITATYWLADERPYSMNEIVDTVEDLLENEFGMEVAHDRMRLPSVASEVALAVDATIQRAGLYNQKIHVLSEMNKTIACTCRQGARRARLPAARRAPGGHAPLDRLVPRERPGDLVEARTAPATGDAANRAARARERCGRASGSRTPSCSAGCCIRGQFVDVGPLGDRARRVRRLLPGEQRGLPRQRRGRRGGRPAQPAHGLAADRARRPLAAHRASRPRSRALVALGITALVNWQTLATLGGLPRAPGRVLARS